MRVASISASLAVLLASFLVPGIAFATPVVFDLRAPGIEDIDEVPSFNLTSGSITATLTANVGVLNRTSAAFGINIVGTSCGGLEDSALLDDGCSDLLGIPNEAVSVLFDQDVLLESLAVSSFGDDLGLVAITGHPPIPITSTGELSLGDTFLGAGNTFTVAFVEGNGFSFDRFTVRSAIPEPTTLLLVSLALAGMGVARRRLY